MKLARLFESLGDGRDVLREWHGQYGNFLYRGSSRATDDIIEIKPRVDRSGSLVDEHPEFNRFLERDTGHEFRNGVFCASNIRVAAHYGTPHIMVPCGRIMCLWNRRVDDMWTAFNHSGLSFEDFYERDYRPHMSQSMSDYLKLGHNSIEISIICDSFYLINIKKYHDFIKYELN